MTYSNPKAKYICINKGEAVVPKEIENQSICVNNDIWAVLREIVPQNEKFLEIAEWKKRNL